MNLFQIIIGEFCRSAPQLARPWFKICIQCVFVGNLSRGKIERCFDLSNFKREGGVRFISTSIFLDYSDKSQYLRAEKRPLPQFTR